MRKAFKFIPPEDVVTVVSDTVSCFIPEQSLSLRELMMRFAYIGEDKLQDIVNRGFDGDEDEDLLGVDIGALDFTEIHDRLVDVLGNSPNRLSRHNLPAVDVPADPQQPIDVPADPQQPVER